MEYITVRQFAEKWGISERRVQKYCAAGRIPGARKFGVSWEIPATWKSRKIPADKGGRQPLNRQQNGNPPWKVWG